MMMCVYALGRQRRHFSSGASPKVVKPERGSVWWPPESGPELAFFGGGPPEAGKGGKGGTWGPRRRPRSPASPPLPPS
jgi:hypothetical protein